MPIITEKEQANPASWNNSCCGDTAKGPVPLTAIPMAQPEAADAPCCGPPPGEPSSPYERPGYRLCEFVETMIETAVGPVPRVKCRLGASDHLGTFRARLGISRDRYRVAPGLYAVGEPGPDSPVLVTANYKLSFDSLRKELHSVAVWILVLDTRGVNVWCAAGKKTFGTDELIRQVKRVQLDRLVNHREIILPQLGAPGIKAYQVKKGCGFTVVWGPIRAADIEVFLREGQTGPEAMRQVTFTLGERLVLIPVEISLLIKPSFWLVLAMIIFSAIGPQFSLVTTASRSYAMAVAYGMGIFGGAVVVPGLLPWLPWRSFYLNGILAGTVLGALSLSFASVVTIYEVIAMILISIAVSSYAAMNFTGATPYASPSGVEKEMRRGIPIQIIAAVTAIVLWVGSPFWLK